MFLMVTPKDIFSQAILCEDSKLNLVSKLWHKVICCATFNHIFFEFIKLVEIVVIQMFGSIEDEQTCSIINFMKNKLWNCLSMHLDLCTRFYSHHFFML
jgi:hypothetical protein